MRECGILMPIFSLPSPDGIGTLGKGAFDFVDFLSSSGQKVWQILPLSPVDFTNSPYQSVSCFAGNPLFIDNTLLCEMGLLNKCELPEGCNEYRVDYQRVKTDKSQLLRLAFSRFNPECFKGELTDFAEENGFWLSDYALYMALCDEYGGWHNFPTELKLYQNDALLKAKAEKKQAVDYFIFEQFVFYKQWFSLKGYAAEKGIDIFGDMPIYAPLESADVWANRDDFLLDGDLFPTVVGGTPPDAFSKTGQIWGCPVYDFEHMKNSKEPFRWWTNRMAHALKIYDRVRIDHFRGLDEFFAIPFADKTAENGKWLKGPGIQLFEHLEGVLGKNLPIVAEDLGTLTDSVHKLLNETGFPGMRVLQFGFDGDRNNLYLPYNFEKNTVAYIGTHDNPTVSGWKAENPECAKRVLDYIGNDSESFNWAVIRLLLSSAANTVILTLQDIMNLDDGRINTPGTVKDNWTIRIDKNCFNSWLCGIIKEITEAYGR